ncbi:hypothetical protein [Polyangium sp. y55x31]|uniref:hypothetical protein n=1 Tax=Polyangium sp. y55x31 TaxID=3042688 RepID=UPI002482A376|nr:hypothetical protein [Polyangium sp. y55x31]MDI1480085.1 hypothetical protein [Polyangium sp. y55x31]
MRKRSAIAMVSCILGLGATGIACQGAVNVGGSNGNGGPLPKADKVDILLVVDNSRSMADKHEVLARATQDLVQSLANPPCVDSNGAVASNPASALDPCPPGQMRRHVPMTDIHVGVISSSLGGHGSDSCPDVDSNDLACSPGSNLTNNDKGHLLSRTDVCGGGQAPTYDGKGFLAWDPKGAFSPPGTSDPSELATNLADMIRGVGQKGCGYESQLESWYRFLVDPEPHASISVVNGEATPQGLDTDLLAQRASFLRPDSMLVILTLTDENDCSIKESGQSFIAAQLRTPGGAPLKLPRPRAECAADPNDPCCKSCAMPQGDCPADPTCLDSTGQVALLNAGEDDPNLRCFDQKRRFGIDFLYPVDRYIGALTQATVPNRAGELVPNPIFSDLDPSDTNANVRDPGLVFVAGIVGVPWQDIARDPSNLSAGYKSPTELAESGTWDAILGDPATGTAPTNPYMIESIEKRSGVTAGNPINGGDRTIGDNDLQYACTFPLLTPRDCSDPSHESCDCSEPNNDNPLCAPDPNNGGARTLQVAAKAYPSPRTMSLIEGVGNQGVLTSICPSNLTDPSADDYAYRPVIRALVERLASRL